MRRNTLAALLLAALTVFGPGSQLFGQCTADPALIVGPSDQYAFQWCNGSIATSIGLQFASSVNEYQFKRPDGTNIMTIKPTGGPSSTYVRMGDPDGGDYTYVEGDGDLRFEGGADILIGNNRYAFRNSGDQDNGLFFSVTNNRYEFRDNAAVPIWYVSANGGGDMYTAKGITLGNSALTDSGTIRWTGLDFEGFDGAIWRSLTLGSDDDWAYTSGSGLTGNIRHEGGVALGTFTNPEGHKLNVQNFAIGKAAIRGAEAIDTVIISEGQLGVTAPTFFPVSLSTAAVMGIKPANGVFGAAVAGWNNDIAFSNYGGLFVADGSGTNNYALFARAENGTNNYAAWLEGRVVVEGTETLSAAGDGLFNVGLRNSEHLSMDGNDVQIYSGLNTPGSALFLNRFGGDINMVDASSNPNGDVNMGSAFHYDGSTDRLGINTTFPGSPLDIRGLTTETVPVLHVEVTSTGTSDVRGIISDANIQPGFGIGLESLGGFIGVDASATGGSNAGIVVGLNGVARGTSGTRIGVYGTGGGNTGTTTNYGVFGDHTADAVTNYAVFASGDLAYTGSLISISDQNFKQDVKPLEHALEAISRLKPHTYTMRNEEYDFMNLPEGRQYGFIAQELEQVLPDLVVEAVHPGKDFIENRNTQEIHFKAVRTIEMIPILVAGVQELQAELYEERAENNTLREEVDALRSRLDAFDLALSACCTDYIPRGIEPGAAPADAPSLGQNIPNPFANETLISYYLPFGTQQAQLRVFDLKGDQVDVFELSDPGFGQVRFAHGDLASGTYLYALFVDGERIATRQMVLVD